ncbi:MAG: capsular polysaccharide synthesis protein [Leuconostoc citreum]
MIMKNTVSTIEKIKQKGIAQQFHQYFASGMLLNAVGNILTLGTSRTTLEIIQMNKMLKVKNNLRRKYRKTLAEKLNSQPGNISQTVWTMWLQGIENAPDIVKLAIQSMIFALPNQQVVVLTKDNFQEYVNIPETIIQKWHKGIISNPHFSDIVRMELLLQQGGTWIDATVMLDHSFNLLEDVLASDETFFFQNMRPGQMGNSIWLSSWLIHARSNEPTLQRVRDIIYDYWNHHSYLIDYFTFHIIWHLVYEFHDDAYRKVRKVPNALPLQLMYMLNQENDEQLVERILSEFPLQKLTYKNISNDAKTTYSYLLERQQGGKND